MRCPCRKKSETVRYAECCGPYHAGLQPAPMAEALMRSRYSAFVLRNTAYLLATWHPTTRPAELDFDGDEAWVQLRVLAASADGDAATVEFIARSRRGGHISRLHEVSRFVREDGRWFYLDGTIKGN